MRFRASSMLCCCGAADETEEEEEEEEEVDPNTPSSSASVIVCQTQSRVRSRFSAMLSLELSRTKSGRRAHISKSTTPKLQTSKLGWARRGGRGGASVFDSDTL